MNFLPKWLSDRFSREVKHEPSVVIKQIIKPDMTETVNSLRMWLAGVIAAIDESYVESCKNYEPDKKKINLYVKSLSPEFRNMGQDDWRALLPELHDLHEICRENNIRLDMTGFDSLPRAGFVTTSSVAAYPNKVEIAIVLNEPYQHLCNPFSEGQIRARLNHKVTDPVPTRLRTEPSKGSTLT